MSNSDDDSSIHGNSSSDEESEKTAKSGINLTGFLFGNIDRDGKLEDDFLDENSKKKLGGLSTVLGLKSIIEEEAGKASTSDSKVESEDYEEGSKVRICLEILREIDFEDIFMILETLKFDFRVFLTLCKAWISPKLQMTDSKCVEITVFDFFVAWNFTWNHLWWFSLKPKTVILTILETVKFDFRVFVILSIAEICSKLKSIASKCVKMAVFVIFYIFDMISTCKQSNKNLYRDGTTVTICK